MRLLKESDPLAKRGEADRQKIVTAGRAKATKALNAAQKLYEDFLERLRAFRVLDPACGSGNFLYLSLLALKDIERDAGLDIETMGLKRQPPRVGPEAVKGIEINPYAAELARVSIWVGEIQWMRRNGFDAGRNPILRPLDNIECRDALIEKDEATGEWREAEWPDADVIVGNPPFLGEQIHRGTRVNITSCVLDAFRGRSWRQSTCDLLVCEGVEERSNAGTARRTCRHKFNSWRRQSSNVLSAIVDGGRIFDAWSDEPWVSRWRRSTGFDYLLCTGR